MHFLKLLPKSTPTLSPFINHWERPHHILQCVVSCILCQLQSDTGARRVGSPLTHQTEAGVNKRAASCQSQERGPGREGQYWTPRTRSGSNQQAQLQKLNFVLCFYLCTVTLPPRPSWRVVPQFDNFCSNVIKGWRLTWQLCGSVTHYLPILWLTECLIN